jgi:hypothetical protein
MRQRPGEPQGWSGGFGRGFGFADVLDVTVGVAAT